MTPPKSTPDLEMRMKGFHYESETHIWIETPSSLVRKCPPSRIGAEIQCFVKPPAYLLGSKLPGVWIARDAAVAHLPFHTAADLRMRPEAKDMAARRWRELRPLWRHAFVAHEQRSIERWCCRVLV